MAQFPGDCLHSEDIAMLAPHFVKGSLGVKLGLAEDLNLMATNTLDYCLRKKGFTLSDRSHVFDDVLFRVPHHQKLIVRVMFR